MNQNKFGTMIAFGGIVLFIVMVLATVVIFDMSMSSLNIGAFVVGTILLIILGTVCFRDYKKELESVTQWPDGLVIGHLE